MENQTENTQAEVLHSNNLNRRLGRFHVSRELLNQQPEKLKPIFANVIVVEAQMRWVSDSVEYLAMSDRFERVPYGQMAPFYDIQFHEDKYYLSTLYPPPNHSLR
jgi:hypothetical protein